ncbi:MAG: hypothetical protein VB878_05085 [Pirellulaceae bacterium]
MKNINFLSDAFLDRQRRRQDRVFLASVTITAITIIISVTIVMCMLHQSVSYASKSLDGEIVSSQQKNADFANLQARLDGHDEKANLLAYLDQQWPISRILSEVTAPLPKQISLIELSYDRNVAANSRKGRKNPFNSVPAAEEDAGSPYACELKALRDMTESIPWIITIEGETTDAAVLHLFVDKLRSSQLFASAHLDGFRTSNENSDTETRLFTLHLTIAAGHAEPGAPQPVHAKEVVAEVSSET